MKKIVRITEGEINNIVKKVLKEDDNWNAGALAHGYGALGYEDAKNDMNDFAKKMKRNKGGKQVGTDFGGILDGLIALGFTYEEAYDFLKNSSMSKGGKLKEDIQYKSEYLEENIMVFFKEKESFINDLKKAKDSINYANEKSAYIKKTPDLYGFSKVAIYSLDRIIEAVEKYKG